MRIFVVSLLLCCPVLAQWPDSSESNLAICTPAGEQAITKIIATDDGGTWLSEQVQVASSVGSTERVNPVAVQDGEEFVVFFRTLDNNQNNDGISAAFIFRRE